MAVADTRLSRGSILSCRLNTFIGDQSMQAMDQDTKAQSSVNCELQSFPIANFEPDVLSSNENITEGFLILAWLIVLLRQKQSNEVAFEWRFSQEFKSEDLECDPRTFTASDVLDENENMVNHGAARIARRVSEVQVKQRSHRRGITLSTSTFGTATNDAKDDVVVHVEVILEDTKILMRPVWWRDHMPEYAAQRYIKSLASTFDECMRNPQNEITAFTATPNVDLDDIWHWNRLLPPTYSYCLHELISERARVHPSKTAIESWDGTLTYDEIDRFSTQMAHQLFKAGVQLNGFVPICFEKSRWTIVAVLAAMKVGATFVLMDPTLPLARLKTMAKQVEAKTMLTSSQQQKLSASILESGSLITVSEACFSATDSSLSPTETTKVPPATLMYVIYTSGSSGVPKGVKISHETYTSSAIPRAAAVGYTSESRVLDFASYAFDVSIDSMLLTVANGGCLCIPSDEDRMNNINDTIRRMRVSYAGLTPSLARILDHDVIASLDALGLGGEAVSARDAANWGKDTRIVIGYGPCECTIGCTINSDAATARPYLSIGRGNGANMWIVDPTNHDILLPVGAVGELLVEGPIVGQGYLNDSEKTKASFIEDPVWLTAGHGDHTGRHGRLYKTGDLGKYDPDGSGGIVFVGRKDTQVKLRGQRIELGEIESQLQVKLPVDAKVIAEVIDVKGPTLVAFITFASTEKTSNIELEQVHVSEVLSATLSEADTHLSNVLPRYMVPAAYITINHIPILISGKTDRKLLRQFGAAVQSSQKAAVATQSLDRAMTDNEIQLRQAWSDTLNVGAERIHIEDSFFALGGDSVTAMKLSSICRALHLNLTVGDVFRHPTLAAMATTITTGASRTLDVAPLSMISSSVENAIPLAAAACRSETAKVQDIYPSTPTQQSLFTFSLKSDKPYVAQRVARIPSNIAIVDWKRAWQQVVGETPILRTRLAQLDGVHGLCQVVLDDAIRWRSSSKLDTYLKSDETEKMDLGDPLARYAIVESPEEQQIYMVWTIHHALYDGWSEPIILRRVQSFLQNEVSKLHPVQMKHFVHHVANIDRSATEQFWRDELDGAVGPFFPLLPNRDYLATPDTILERFISFRMPLGCGHTLATLIRGAWALVSSQYTGIDDVVFGETLMGRDIALPGVETIIGPLIATVPIRVHINGSSTVDCYLREIQQSVLARTPYQHMGWQNIRKVSQYAQYVSEVGTGLVIQPQSDNNSSALGFEPKDPVREALHFNPYPLMLACGTSKSGFNVCANFDSSLIASNQMERILAQLEVVCRRFATGLTTLVKDVSCLPESELNQIWRWNQIPPLSFDPASASFRASKQIKPGSTYPQAMISWVCDVRNPSKLASIGCLGELWLEGNSLSGPRHDALPWLLAGSSMYPGRKSTMQPTGDLVRLREDGSIVFAGRKADQRKVGLTSLQTILGKHLEGIKFALVSPNNDDKEGKRAPKVVVVFEELPSTGAMIRLLPTAHRVVLDRSALELSENISHSLATKMKKLDRAVRNLVPSYLVPSAYLCVKDIPTDQSTLDKLISNIPSEVYDKLNAALTQTAMQKIKYNDVSSGESILRLAWAEVLNLNPAEIDDDDSFFRLGGDSVLAMKMASTIRSQGHGLTVADIFPNMLFADMAKVLRVDRSSPTATEAYRPFSTLPDFNNTELLLHGTVRTKLADQTWEIQDVCPVTHSQSLDIKATVTEPRTSVQYTTLSFEQTPSREKLINALSALVETHDILRTIFVETESNVFLQIVLKKLEVPMDVHRCDSDLDDYCRDFCKKDIEGAFSLGAPFVKFVLVDCSDGSSSLIIRLSHAQYDGISLPRLLKDFEALYMQMPLDSIRPLAHYISHISQRSFQDQAQNYWRQLLDGSRLSTVEGASTSATASRSMFVSAPVAISNLPPNLSTVTLLTSVWALILARRGATKDVTFGNVTSGRSVEMTNIEHVVGPCYSFAPVRVVFKPEWTAGDLLAFVQKQIGESAPYDGLGFDNIAKCAGWRENEFYDSIVHHHPDISDVDSMPFAGYRCKVDIMNPHGDAAHPLKIITFNKRGRTHAGVVGCDRAARLVHTILNEVVAGIDELLGMPAEQCIWTQSPRLGDSVQRKEEALIGEGSSDQCL